VQNNIRVFVISRSFLLGMKSVSEKNCRDNQNTHFMFSNLFFSPENLAVYEIMWENYCRAGQATGDNMAHMFLWSFLSF
jgi:hypothetical protein